MNNNSSLSAHIRNQLEELLGRLDNGDMNQTVVTELQQSLTQLNQQPFQSAVKNRNATFNNSSVFGNGYLPTNTASSSTRISQPASMFTTASSTSGIIHHNNIPVAGNSLLAMNSSNFSKKSLTKIANDVQKSKGKYAPSQPPSKKLAKSITLEFVLKIILLKGPDEDTNDPIITTWIRFDKYWDTQYTKQAIEHEFSEYLNGCEFRLKHAKYGGKLNRRELTNVDDKHAVPCGFVLHEYKKLKGLYVVPTSDIVDRTMVDSSDDSDADNIIMLERTNSPSFTRVQRNLANETLRGLPQRGLPQQSMPLRSANNDVISSTRHSTVATATYEHQQHTTFDSNISDSDDDNIQELTPGQTYKNFCAQLKIGGSIDIEVRRSHLLEDSIGLLSSADFDPYKTPTVKFIGEKGIDGGGVRTNWIWEVGNKIMTSTYRGIPIFDGVDDHKLPSALIPDKQAVWTAVANFALCSMIHGKYALLGLSPVLLDFLTKDVITDDLNNCNWSKKDLTFTYQLAVEQCQKLLLNEELSEDERENLRDVALECDYTDKFTTESIHKFIKQIVYYDIFKSRMDSLQMFKARLETSGILMFLRMHKDCLAYVFPLTEAQNVPVRFLKALLQPYHEATEASELYERELTAIETINAYLDKNAKRKDLLKKFIKAFTGSCDVPDICDKFKIQANDRYEFRTCGVLLKVPPHFTEEMFALGIETAGGEDSPFDAY